jgi:hypothetical protein
MPINIILAKITKNKKHIFFLLSHIIANTDIQTTFKEKRSLLAKVARKSKQSALGVGEQLGCAGGRSK